MTQTQQINQKERPKNQDRKQPLTSSIILLI